VFSQQGEKVPCIISGHIFSNSGEPLNGAIVLLKSKEGVKTLAFSITTNNGSFQLELNIDSAHSPVSISVGMSGHQSKVVEIDTLNFCNTEKLKITLQPSAKQLKEIVIKAPSVPIKNKGDTVEFNAKSYMNPQTRKLQDLFANMPGFQVSADGKISYNGKEVEKILIEGEDLAEKNYKLISRNLNAAWINKIQLLNNYNDDHLLKEVFESDKIGINITVNEDVKNKLTGSLNAGLGSRSRVSADNSLIFLQAKIKWLSFLNYNNTGDQADADIGYFYNNDDPDQVEQGLNNDELLQTGRIFPPELSNQYVRNNKEFAGAAIASWKIGRYGKMKTMLSNSDGQLRNEAGGLQQTFLPDGTQWLIKQNQHALAESRKWYGIISFQHDNKADHVGYFSIDGVYGKRLDQYSNSVIGEINDSAFEDLKGKNFALRVKGYETWKHSPGKVFTLNYDASYGYINNGFNALTSRYIDYFNIDSSWVKFLQQLLSRNFTAVTEAGWYVRKKKIDYGVKWKTAFLNSDYDAQNKAFDLLNNSLELSSPASKASSFNNSITGTSFKQISRKQAISMTAMTGLQYFNLKDYQKSINRLLPLYTATIKYTYSFKPNQFINAQYQLSSGNIRFNMFFPDSMISGNASVMQPADTLVAPVVNRINLQFVSYNVYKASSLMLTFSYSLASKEYTQTTDLFPSYMLTGYFPISGNRHINMLINAEKYVAALKVKFIAQPSMMVFRTNTIINGLRSNNDISTTRLVGKMVTGLKWPVNVELSGTALYVCNKTRSVNGEWIAQEFWQYQASSKVKVQLSEKLYLAALYQYRQLATPSRFQTMDLFTQFIINPAVRVSLNAHNLFNSPALVQQFVTASQYGEQRFELMKRYFLFKVDWSF
jgi:hypothetical protein